MKKVNKLKQPQQEQKVETIKVKNQKASAELSLIELETKEDLEINDLDSKNKITAFDWNSAKANFETVQNEINEVNTRLNYIQSLLTLMNELSSKYATSLDYEINAGITVNGLSGTKTAIVNKINYTYNNNTLKKQDFIKNWFLYMPKTEYVNSRLIMEGANFNLQIINVQDNISNVNKDIKIASFYVDSAPADQRSNLSRIIGTTGSGSYDNIQQAFYTDAAISVNLTSVPYVYYGGINSYAGYTTTAIKEKWAATPQSLKDEFEQSWQFLKKNISSYGDGYALKLPLGEGTDTGTVTSGKSLYIVKGYLVSGASPTNDRVSIYYIGYGQTIAPDANEKWLFNGCMTWVADFDDETTSLENTINYFINNYPNYPNGELTLQENQTILGDLLSKEITDRIGFGVSTNNTVFPRYKGLIKNKNIWNALSKRDNAWNENTKKKINNQVLQIENHDTISL